MAIPIAEAHPTTDQMDLPPRLNTIEQLDLERVTLELLVEDIRNQGLLTKPDVLTTESDQPQSRRVPPTPLRIPQYISLEEVDMSGVPQADESDEHAVYKAKREERANKISPYVDSAQDGDEQGNQSEALIDEKQGSLRGSKVSTLVGRIIGLL